MIFLYIAHRGLVNNGYKENTIDAFKAAINSSKYIGFELDVRETKDQEFIVYHNLTYKGKLIKNILLKDIEKNIPKLEDVLKLETDKIIMIEIKDFNLNYKKLSKLLNKYNFKKIYISSFNNNVLKVIKPKLKNIKVGCLNYILNSEDDYKGYDFICLINSILSEKLINYFKKQNIEVFSYGVRKKKKVFNDIYYIVDDVKM